MKISSECIERVTVVLDMPIRILKAFCIGPATNPVENDSLNSDYNNIFSPDTKVLEEGKNIKLITGESHKLLFTDITNEYNTGLEFSKYELEENQRMFLFANIYSNEDKNTLLRFGKNCKSKIWINKTLVFSGYADVNENSMVLFPLKKGNNLVMVEYSPTDNSFGDIFSMRINECDGEPTQFENDIMNNYLKQNVEASVQVVCKNYIITNNYHTFLIKPMDFLNVDTAKALSISICDSSQTELGSIQAGFNQPIVLDKSQFFRNVKSDPFLNIKLLYKTIDETYKESEFTIISDEFLSYIDQEMDSFEAFLLTISEEYYRMFYTGLLNDFKKASIQLKDSLINNSTQAGAINKYVYFYKKLKYIISKQKAYSAIDELIYGKGRTATVYYKSKLDEKIKKFNICAPDNYTSEKKYPLIINLFPIIWMFSSHYYKLLPKNISEEVIFTSISSRNVTLGSYMGEASIFESIEEVKKLYNVDESRIYLLGFSNDSYACWSLVQAYPHLFAAIVPLSGGQYLKNINNNICTPFYTIYGDKDYPIFSKDIEEINSWLEKNKDVVPSKLSIIKEADHWFFFTTTFYNKVIIEWLLQHKNKMFEKKSYFRTERIIHKGNEWIQILSVEQNAKFCEFETEVKSYSDISINIKNVQKFTLRLPDYIDSNNLNITINKDDIFIEKINMQRELCFSKINGRYMLSDNNNNSYSMWGMGLLSIYMDSLKIIIPSTFSSSHEEKIVSHIAHQFSQPKSHGYDPNIDVEYPIYKDDTSHDIMEASNIILIGYNSNNSYINAYQNKLKLQIDEKGFSYNNRYYSRNYSIIFIQQNPINPAYKMLIAYSNDLDIFRRNLIVRRLIIPTYVNGFHPYLNCEVILFDGKDIMVANAIGDELYTPKA